jgi:hypothetical protein
MDSEFKQFIDALRRLGISFEIDYAPAKKRWQKIIFDVGYYVTVLGCLVVRVGDTEHLFSTGAVCWTIKEQAIGPTGLFLLSRNKAGKVTPRCRFVPSVSLFSTDTNLKAIMAQYPDYNWDDRVQAPAQAA